jgi:hypothetical protein
MAGPGLYSCRASLRTGGETNNQKRADTARDYLEKKKKRPRLTPIPPYQPRPNRLIYRAEGKHPAASRLTPENRHIFSNCR